MVKYSLTIIDCQYVTYLVKLLPGLQVRFISGTNDHSVVSFVETCAMKCFSVRVPGLTKAAAIALISHCVDNIYNCTSTPVATCSNDEAVRMGGLLLVLLMGDRYVHTRSALQQPFIACCVVHTIFLYMEKELNLVSANGQLVLAVRGLFLSEYILCFLI